MNKAIEVLLNRRSCRNFSKKKISDKKIEQIVECGMYAPSALNKQTANMLVIQNKRMLNKIRKLSLKVCNRDVSYGATCLIMVYGKKDEPFVVQDCSLVMQNLMLAGEALHINSCWINQYNELLNKKFREELELNDSYIVGTCALGYNVKKEKILARPRKENYVRFIK